MSSQYHVVGSESSFQNTLSTDFDGINEYVDCGDPNDLSFGNSVTDSPFSISIWAYMHATANFRMFSKFFSGTLLEYNFDTVGGSVLRFGLYDNTSGNNILRSGDVNLSAFANTWVHLVGTYDGSGNSSGLKLYVDGALYASTGSTAGTYVAMHNTLAMVTIGRTASTHANGLMNNNSIWSKELSLAEVQEIYNSGTPKDLNTHSSVANLVSWWRMGQGDTFPTITDNAGSNNGTMINMSAGNFVANTPP